MDAGTRRRDPRAPRSPGDGHGRHRAADGLGDSDRGHAARADWSAGPVARGTGYARAGGSRRVREVQRRLRSLGYHPGPVDGLYGPRTERAARRFQEARRLRADAVVGPRTLLALRTRDDARRPAATPPPAPAPLPTAVPAPAPRSAAPATAPQRSPFPFATVLAILGVLGLGGRRRELRQDATSRPRRDPGVAAATARTQVGGGTGMRDVRVVIADPDALAGARSARR